MDLIITKVISALYVSTDAWRISSMVTREINGIVYCLEGSINYESNRGYFKVSAGDLVFLPEGLSYCGKKNSKTNKFYVINFKTDVPLLNSNFQPSIKPKSPNQTLKSFKDAAALWNEGTTESKLFCLSKIYGILAEYFSIINQKENSSPIIRNVLSYISANLSDYTLSLQELSNQFNISTSQLRRYFHQGTGTSPIKYITKKRIELSQTYLQENNIQIQEIASLCGFSSDYYFSRVFKKATGLTPREYANQYKTK